MSEPTSKPSQSGFFAKTSVVLAGLVSIVGALTLLLGGIPKLVESFKDAACAVATCAKEPTQAAGKSPAKSNICRVGFVWREAFDGDVACVSPDVRKATWADNAAAASRSNADGSCKHGYFWRAARPSDHVCVTAEVVRQVVDDNAAAPGRVAPAN